MLGMGRMLDRVGLQRFYTAVSNNVSEIRTDVLDWQQRSLLILELRAPCKAQCVDVGKERKGHLSASAKFRLDTMCKYRPHLSC